MDKDAGADCVAVPHPFTTLVKLGAEQVVFFFDSHGSLVQKGTNDALLGTNVFLIPRNKRIMVRSRRKRSALKPLPSAIGVDLQSSRPIDTGGIGPFLECRRVGWEFICGEDGHEATPTKMNTAHKTA